MPSCGGLKTLVSRSRRSSNQSGARSRSTPMPEVQSLKSSAELRQELAGIDLDVLRFEGDLASETAKIKLHALSARRGDPAAVKRIAESEAKKRAIEISISHAHYSNELLAGGIVEAQKHEDYERRKLGA